MHVSVRLEGGTDLAQYLETELEDEVQALNQVQAKILADKETTM